MYDEEYIKRITYGTPENIRIRRFYNQLNNRPLNYGMEELFPNVNSYTAEPMSAVNNVNLEQRPSTKPDLPQRSEQVRYSDLTMRQLLPTVQAENGPSVTNFTIKDYYPMIAIPYNLKKIKEDYDYYAPLAVHDKFKHAVMNCHAAQNGYWGNLFIKALSDFKEGRDIKSGNNSQEESDEDMAANLIGRYLGNRYPDYDCENMLSHYISRKYPRR